MTSKERHQARYERRKAKREAKRREYLNQYDSYDRVTSVSALIGAGRASRKGVMWKASVARYSVKGFRNARKSARMLKAGKDTRQGFYHFQIVERGKPRDVHSLHYAERVIRRSVCTNALVPMLSHTQIYDNGASLENKGIGFAVNRCSAHLHEFFRKTGSNDGYVLVIDFRKFFDNIEHGPMYDVLNKHLHDCRLNHLCKGFVDATGPKGLYIGPEDSQIFAIAFPGRIDHFIKDTLRLKYYGRYMDDSYIIMRDKGELMKVRDMLLAEYAKQGIIVNPKKTQIVKLSRGFTFLKTQFFLQPSGRLLRKPSRTTIVRERRKLKAFKRFMDHGDMTLKDIQYSYMSWRGSLLHSKNAHRTVRAMDSLFFSLFAAKPWINTKYRKG